MEIFFKGNVPSSKNSKRIVKGGLISSKTVYNYMADYEYQFMKSSTKRAFLESLEGLQKPYRIGFYFHRKTKQRFDYVNIVQILLDLMVRHNFLQDDNADEVIPVFLGYEHDKENPGVIIKTGEGI